MMEPFPDIDQTKPSLEVKGRQILDVEKKTL